MNDLQANDMAALEELTVVMRGDYTPYEKKDAFQIFISKLKDPDIINFVYETFIEGIDKEF